MNLSHSNYCPNLRPTWSVQNEILKRVNIEAEKSVVLPDPPRMSKVELKRKKWGKVALAAFKRQVMGLRP